jgi:hypothetical protein
MQQIEDWLAKRDMSEDAQCFAADGIGIAALRLLKTSGATDKI